MFNKKANLNCSLVLPRPQYEEAFFLVCADVYLEVLEADDERVEEAADRVERKRCNEREDEREEQLEGAMHNLIICN